MGNLSELGEGGLMVPASFLQALRDPCLHSAFSSLMQTQPLVNTYRAACVNMHRGHAVRQEGTQGAGRGCKRGVRGQLSDTDCQRVAQRVPGPAPSNLFTLAAAALTETPCLSPALPYRHVYITV